MLIKEFLDGSDSKESMHNVGNLGSMPGLGKSPGEGNGYPLQYSCLDNPMDRGACRSTVHGVTKSRTLMSDEECMMLIKVLISLGVTKQ